MTLFEAIILGLVQGLAEFLPISSSGHLALVQHFFGIEGESVLIFAVLLHLGTLFSVFAIYYKDIAALIIELFAAIKDIFTGKGFGFYKNETRTLGYMIIVATIPTAIIGIVFNDIFSSFYTNMTAIGIGLLITGTILFISEKFERKGFDLGEMKFRHALLVGVCQGIAITPGISRSGSTLFGSLISGLKKETAVKYAFLISIPSILGSVVLEGPKAFESGMDTQLLIPIIVGVLVAAISGFLAIKTMISFVSKNKLKYFSVYTWILGALVVVHPFIEKLF